MASPGRPRLSLAGTAAGGADHRYPRLGPFALGGLLLTSVLICLSAAKTSLLLPSSLRPLPEWLAGPFARVGPELGLAAVIATLAALLVSYALAVRPAQRLSPRIVVLSIVVLHLIAVLAPPLFSSDVFSYTAYARIGTLYGSNPYLHGPGAFPLEALHPLIGLQWIETPTVYGPLFTACSYLLAPFGIATNVLAYKLIAACSSLVLIYLVWRAASLRGLDPTKAAALVGLNPVIVLFGVGGGHNDLLMLALIVAGIYVLLRRREMPGGALLIAATAVKLTAGIVLPFAFVARRAEGGGLPGRRMVLGAAGAASLVLVLAYCFFGTGPLAILGTLQGIQAEGGAHSIVGFLAAAVGLAAITGAVDTALTLVFLGVVVWLLRRVWVGELDWIAGAGWATVALLLTTGFLVPWYVAWLIPLAALSHDRRLSTVSVLLTGIGLTTL